VCQKGRGRPIKKRLALSAYPIVLSVSMHVVIDARDDRCEGAAQQNSQLQMQ
jgi:hypothetical protein